MYFRHLLYNHWVALVLALLIAFSMVAPELIMRRSLGDDFRGIYMHGSDAELFYLARMNQTYRDISAWDSPFLYEYRGEFPVTYALFADPILGYPGKWLGIPVQEINLIYKTIFSAIIFLLIYSLIFRLTRDRWWSVAGAILIMTGYRLITIPGIMDFLTWREHHSQFLLFSRTVTSQSTWIIFWSFLHLFLSVLQKREWRYFIGCGVLFGLSFYIQFYLWTFFAAMIAIVFAGSLILKQTKLAGRTIVLVLIGSVIALPYILNMAAFVRHEHFSFYKYMTLLVDSRQPNISKIGIVVALLFIPYLIKSKSRSIEDMFLLSLLATTFVTTNQQILTGRLLEVGHYHWFFNIFVHIFILAYLAYRTSLTIDKKWIKFALAGVVIISFTNGYLIQSSSYKANAQGVLTDQAYVPILDWLKENTSSSDVIFSNSDHISLLIPVYTNNFVYWHSGAPLYMMPPERFETAVFMHMKLNNIQPSKIGGESFFHDNPSREQENLVAEYPDLVPLFHIQFRQGFLDGMLERYKNFYRQGWDENFSKFRLDYFIYKKGSVAWNLSNIKFLKPLRQFGDITIYENTLSSQ